MAQRERSVDRVYLGLVKDLSGLLEEARRSSARAVNAVMTFTYWEIGRRIVEFEQGGEKRAEYGGRLVAKLSEDLTRRFGRGFSRPNIQRFRDFYVQFPRDENCSTLSSKSADGAPDLVFTLPWSHYVRLLSIENPLAREFYQAEALRGGWSVRQLDRQIATQFYERTALSKNKAAMLKRGAAPRADGAVTVDEEVKDPLVLEFLGLKDEYSESDLEEALSRDRTLSHCYSCSGS